MEDKKIRVAFERPEFFVDVSENGICVELEGIELVNLKPNTAVQHIVHEGEPNDWPATEDIDGALNFSYAEEDGIKRFVWATFSNVWKKKEYILECDSQGFNYFVRVYGDGYVGDINYFAANQDNRLVGSRYGFCEYYVPTCDTSGKEANYYPASLPYETYFELMVPPMYVYAFRTTGLDPWAGIGLMAKPGNYNFVRYDYKKVSGGFTMNVPMEGHQKVDGCWELPFIRFYLGEDECDVVETYADYHYETGLVKDWKAPVVPRWWMGPIFCGWGAQGDIASREGTGVMCQACEKAYNEMVDLLDKRGLKPSYIIIDDRWQDHYGTAYPHPEQWPDMRAFVEKMHARNVKVLLWFRLWGGHGLPDDETMPGDPVKNWNKNYDERYADPSNPKYQARLREILRTLLSDEEGCMNVDGFKLDFAFWMPYGRRAVSYSGQYGTELLKSLFRQIYTRSKEVKPEALINCSPCHPYFSEYCDQLRLHDYDSSRNACMEVMGDRQWMFTTACHGQSVDTDNVGYGNKRDYMTYCLHSKELGIPDLYHIADPKSFTMSDEDWAIVRKSWEDYSREMDEKFAE